MATILGAVSLQAWIPLLTGQPRLDGTLHQILTELLPYMGLADNVIDHRLSSRTVYMNPVSRFIYWNMNDHAVHHMLPKVPSYDLPRLRDLIRHGPPAPLRFTTEAFRETVPALRRQPRNHDHYLRRELPPAAQPDREDLHAAALGIAA